MKICLPGLGNLLKKKRKTETLLKHLELFLIFDNGFVPEWKIICTGNIRTRDVWQPEKNKLNSTGTILDSDGQMLLGFFLIDPLPVTPGAWGSHDTTVGAIR